MKLKRKSFLTDRNSNACMALLVAGGLMIGVKHAQADAKIWKNTGTDFNTAGNWTGGVPGSGDVAKFPNIAAKQPNLSQSLTIAGINFANAFDYDITSTNFATFILNGFNPSGAGGTSPSTAAAIRSDSFGTNTVDASLILAPSVGSSPYIFQASGGTLVLNGVVSAANGIDVRFEGGGTIELNGANTFSSASVPAQLPGNEGETIVVGNDGGLGTGTFTTNNVSTLQAGGGARTIATNIVAGADTTIGGSDNITFNGSITGSGAATRTLTVANTAATTFAGNVFLQDSASTGHNLTINGSSNLTISGVIKDGGTGPGSLSYAGTGTLTLSNANTYSGGTTISNGNVIANHDGAFGTGNVSLTAGAITLTLQNGATNQYIGSGANFSIAMANVVNLNYVGSNVIGSLTVDGITLADGLYGAGPGATNPDGIFTGTGFIVAGAIPEPSVYMLLGVGLLICGQRFFRHRSVS